MIVILGILLILASFGAQVAANEIDSRVSEDCEDAVGSIGEIIGADEEQCQDARDLRDSPRSAFLPLMVSWVSNEYNPSFFHHFGEERRLEPSSPIIPVLPVFISRRFHIIYKSE